MKLTVKYPADTYVRTARTNHSCRGQHNGKRLVACRWPIRTGESYIEFMDSAPLYSSGDRYHWYCAVTQGIVELDTENSSY